MVTGSGGTSNSGTGFITTTSANSNSFLLDIIQVQDLLELNGNIHK